jgi:prevent-host-death family protein
MQVGVRELKQRLSEFLDRAARGEQIQVTDRGVPKAVLGPLPGRQRLDEGIAEGWVRAGKEMAVARVKPAKGRRRISDALDEDRGT